MKTVKAFQTSDGRIWETEDQARKHETFLVHSVLIDKYLDSEHNPYRGSQRVIARNTIVSWETWTTENVK